MKIKRLLCYFLSAFFALTALVSCGGTSETTTDITATEAVTTEAETEPEDTSAPVIEYSLNTDITLKDYDFEDKTELKSTSVEFKNGGSEDGCFGFVRNVVTNDGTITYPKNDVGGVYTKFPSSDTGKSTYSFTLKNPAKSGQYRWFTIFIGLRLAEPTNDPTAHTGVWLAIRNTKIGMRMGEWPETTYTDSGIDVSEGEKIRIVDDPVSNTITIYGGADYHEIAIVKIDGKSYGLYKPGETETKLTDTVDKEIPKCGYFHLWSHILPQDAVITDYSCDGLMKTVVISGENDGIKQNTRDVHADTWTAYDDVGREITYSGVTPNEKKVGIFYFLWHEEANTGRPIYDHTTSYEKGGMDQVWKTINQGEIGSIHYWGQPYFGYYCTNDEWVLRKHGAMLAEAGVDFVYFDATNGPLYKTNYEAVMRVWTKMRKEGLKTPDVCFILKDTDKKEFDAIWNDLYKANLYEDIWFKWRGKPVLMFISSLFDISEEQKDFFTIRISWATEAEEFGNGWYKNRSGYDCWPWASMYPQKPGFRKDDGKRVIEQMVVMCGFWADGSFGTDAGRSYTKKTGEPFELAESDWNMGFGLYPETSGLGLAFQECFDHAIIKDPELIMITGWNEWWAGRYEDAGKRMAGEYTSTKSGDTKNTFCDNFNAEYSRDIEPMTGGFKDNYYYQMVQNVRKYKGSRPPETAFGQSTIDLDGSAVQWYTVGPEFRDVYGDTVKRNHVSNVGKLRYINATGRNDILTAKISSDNEYLYFMAECAADITPREGDNWMNLFIKSDNDDKTGWYGFDYIINRSGDGGKASVEKFKDGWEFEKVGDAEYKVDGKTIQIKIKASLIGYNGKLLDFKWADNSVNDGEIMCFLDKGDAAPDARFCYRFTTEETKAEIPACLTSDMAVFKSNGYYAYINGKLTKLGDSTKTTLLATGYDFYLPVDTLKILGIDCAGETEYDHYGVKYVKANAPVEKAGKAVTVTSDGLLVISNEKITDTNVLTTLYRALY